MSKYALKQAQLRLETEAVSRGIERYQEAHAKEEERGREFDMPVAERAIRDYVLRLVPAFRTMQAECLEHNMGVVAKGGQRVAYAERLNMVAPEVLAYVTVKTVLVAGGRSLRVTRLSKILGERINLEIRWAEARKLEAAAAKERGHSPPNGQHKSVCRLVRRC